MFSNIGIHKDFLMLGNIFKVTHSLQPQTKIVNQNNLTMRPLINFSILLLLPLVIGFSSRNATIASGTGHAADNDHTYCNARFDFCLQYPDAIFTQSVKSDNDDGISLYSEDGLMRAKAYGAYNIEGATMEGLYQMLVNELATTNSNLVIMSNDVGKTAYEATFLGDKEMYYYRIVTHPDNIILTLMIAVPNGMEEMLHSLQKDMVLNTHS